MSRSFEPLPLVNDEHRFIVFWMPKCGATTICKWVFRTLGVLDEALAFDPYVHEYRIRIHYPKLDVLARLPDLLTSHYRFVVVRNPFARAVSGYLMAMEHPGWYRDPPDQHLSFAQFVDYLSVQDLETCDMHWRAQTSNRCWHGVELDHVVRLESFSRDMERVSARFGLPARWAEECSESEHHQRKSSDDRGETCSDLSFEELVARRPRDDDGRPIVPSYRRFYTAELVERVARLYRRDLERLDYSFADL